MNAASLHSSILRAYDIRGIFEETLNEPDARAIGRAFAQCLRDRSLGNKVAVGRDGRLSSPCLAKALIEGLVDGGANVIDIGCGPTPMLYFAATYLATDGAIQVTGSHNPPTHNGFKMVMAGKSFFGDDIKSLGETIASGVPSHPGGRHEEYSIFDAYVARLVTDANAGNLSVVWDCGNGASGPATKAVVEQLSGTHEVLFAEIDGTFPNHHPNPVDPETLEMLRVSVAEKKADLGIGFDGDGDRIGVIDAKGRQVPGDLLTAYLAQDVAARHPGKTMLLDVKSSQLAVDLMVASGADPQIWKTGHSHMKKRMGETGAPLAGEMSGHIFIADGFYGFDDALYVAVRVVSQMVQSGQSITDFMDGLPPQHATPELRIECADDQKFAVMERLSGIVATKHDPQQVNTIDGVRVKVGDGWWLVRASNTEAALVARAEAGDAATLERLVSEIQTSLALAGLDCSFD
jgi:phosphomannomutase